MLVWVYAVCELDYAQTAQMFGFSQIVEKSKVKWCIYIAPLSHVSKVLSYMYSYMYLSSRTCRFTKQ